MRICILSSSLNSGGAERVLSILANNLSGFYDEVYLITHSQVINDFYEVNSKVKRIELSPLIKTKNPFHKIYNNYIAVKQLRSRIKALKPDIIISFLTQVNVRAIIANIGINIPLIISERSNPRLQKIENIWRILRYLMYNKANKIVVQNSRISEYFSAIPFKSEKLVIIPNPIPDYSNLAKENVNDLIYKTRWNDKELIGTMGSLTYPKGHDLLIKAFHKIKDKINCNLVIIGEGDQKLNLKKLISQLDLNDRVILADRLKNPFPLLKKFRIFILPSRYEGFPNALLEALSLGLPVISFDCETGPRELISTNWNGILVKNGDINELADELYKLWTNKALQLKLSKNAVKVLTKYSEFKIVKQWQELIYETIQNKYKS